MEKDIINLAKWVISDIIADGAKKAFIDGDMETKIDIVLAYVDSIIKKVEKLQTTYLTNPEAKKLLQESILRSIINKP